MGVPPQPKAFWSGANEPEKGNQNKGNHKQLRSNARRSTFDPTPRSGATPPLLQHEPPHHHEPKGECPRHRKSTSTPHVVHGGKGGGGRGRGGQSRRVVGSGAQCLCLKIDLNFVSGRFHFCPGGTPRPIRGAPRVRLPLCLDFKWENSGFPSSAA